MPMHSAAFSPTTVVDGVCTNVTRIGSVYKLRCVARNGHRYCSHWRYSRNRLHGFRLASRAAQPVWAVAGQSPGDFMWCAFSDRCVCLNVSIALFDAVLWVTVGAPKPTKSCRRVAYLAVQAGTGTTLARRSGISSPLPATSDFAQLGTGRYPAQTKTSQRSLGYAPSTFTIRTFAKRTCT